MKLKLILFLLSFSVSIAQQFNLKVVVRNLEGRKGNISIGLFDKEDGFPKKEFGKIGIELPIQDSVAEYNFTNLEKGNYAVAIFNDENSDGELNRSIFGWPTEDYVFSNFAKSSFGPPKFTDASFILDKDLELILKF